MQLSFLLCDKDNWEYYPEGSKAQSGVDSTSDGKVFWDPTLSCAIVLAAGWKQYSHMQALPCCPRSVIIDTQQGQKLPYIKERDKWLNNNLFSLETAHTRKDKDTKELPHEGLEMETHWT